ncbi:MAG: nucleotidyltransferase domain-containing protein [Candidatus Thermoplasmatota archaeon]|nr:nucleotidyltransferase domain-containing protein [Candidatus Thermoplasmatota archaeon]
MNNDKILSKIDKIPYFNKLKFVYLFGSSCNGKLTKRSDIDLCFYYDIKDKKKLYKLMFKISSVFPDKYDIQMFQLLPLYIKKEVFKGKLIYSVDREYVHDIARTTIEEYNDFKPRYKYILYGKNKVEGAFL